MTTLQIIIVLFIAFEHFYFMILEMFYWTKPQGLKAFGLKLEEAKTTKVLAQNQGLYNGFLAAGLVWAVLIKNPSVALFFLICITIAGIYGAYSTKKNKIFLIQSIPAILGIILFLFQI
ncbi:putative membrane protein [Lutibacter oricola]|uniref:Putative membrane protein n=1 Tax=Lutibacter oricola TaxID=762486 RepID=A0A1H2SWC5_9FLAO|nr:DUF1304 domain-containing protein [Lutibacter oricola]SDW35996.1 putative membrane protein [Lutibacter oricola]